MHTVVGTAANVNDVTYAHALVDGEETNVFADASHPCVGKRDEAVGPQGELARGDATVQAQGAG